MTIIMSNDTPIHNTIQAARFAPPPDKFAPNIVLGKPIMRVIAQATINAPFTLFGITGMNTRR